MRNLKRALALALASVMMMSMMTVGAGAVTFNDADEINNVTAATVLEALDIMVGDDEGNFNASAVVTRAEMCVLMCKAFYGADYTATVGGSTTFTDISGHWGEAYIEAAYAAGWISGKDAQTFDPNATVLTYEAALMMQRVLGYYSTNDDATYTMPASSVSLINKLKMFDGISTPSSMAGLTRDDVAVLVYNTMFDCVKVDYSYANKIYYACDVAGASVTDPTVSFDFGVDGTLAADVHDVTIVRGTDIMGRPTDEVKVDGDTLATSAVDAEATFIADTEIDDVNDEGDVKIDAADELYLNGDNSGSLNFFCTEVFGYDYADAISGDKDILNGYVVEVYNFDGDLSDADTSDDTVVYVAYNYFVGEIYDEPEYDEDEDETTIKINDGTNGKTTYTIGGDVTDAFAEDDMVTFTAKLTTASNELDTIVIATGVEGEVTGSASTYYYVDGTKYSFADVNDVETYNLGTTAMLYLDPNGYVIGSEEIDGVATAYDYLYVLAVDANVASFDDTFDIKALFADGTSAVITVYELDGYEHNDEISTGVYQDLTTIALGDVYEYDIDDDGYELTSVATADVEFASGADIETGYTKNTAGSYTITGFNDDTVFVSKEDGTTWVGYENVADFSGADVTAILDSGDVVVVFVTAVEADSSDDGIYVILEDNGYYTTKIDGDTYRVYEDAYIEGEQVDLIVEDDASNTMRALEAYEITVDDNGYVTDVALVSAAGASYYFADKLVSAVGSYTITAGGTRFTYDSDTIFMFVNTDGEISDADASDIYTYDTEIMSDDEYVTLTILVDDASDLDAVLVIISELVY